MATKKTGQDQDSTSEKAADAAPGSVSQAAAVPPTAAALSQSGAAPASEQSGAPAASAVPAASAAPAPSTTVVDANAAPGSVQELPGYMVTDVSSVLHDGNWYHQGDDIFLNDKDAAPLLDRRIIKPSRSEK